ncbi:hypothetical protein DFH09DRAFT_1094766 [Mycena vulgaris]|nr:hypothetical protein DFH09DRAFT_1094766 [Mycena vulgaris]
MQGFDTHSEVETRKTNSVQPHSGRDCRNHLADALPNHVGEVAHIRATEGRERRLYDVGVHSNDGVPTMVPTKLGYMHQNECIVLASCAPDEVPLEQTRICNGAGLLDDPQGSMKIPSTDINPAHLSKTGIELGVGILILEVTVESVGLHQGTGEMGTSIASY